MGVAVKEQEDADGFEDSGIGLDIGLLDEHEG